MNETVSKSHFSFALLHAAQAVGDQLESALNEHGLSMAKQSALSKLAEAGEPLTLSELAARLSCVRSNITQLVDRLEADGKVHHVGGIRYVIKDGILYDAHKLLEEVAAMVEAQKAH